MQDPLGSLFGGAGGGESGGASFSLIESLLQLALGQPIYGKNCGPSVASDTYIDDLVRVASAPGGAICPPTPAPLRPRIWMQDHCCHIHDLCHQQPEQQAAYRYCEMGNPGLDTFLRSFGVACQCDAALVRCIDRVRGRCDSLPSEQRGGCRARNAYKLSKAADIHLAFTFLDNCAKCPAA